MSSFIPTDLLYMAPLLILISTGVLLVLAEAFFQGRDRSTLATLTAASAIAAMIAAIALYKYAPPNTSLPLLSGMLVFDRVGQVMVALFCGTIAAVALMTAPHQRTHGWENGEFYGLLLLGGSGMVILAQAGNLASIFLGVETMSIAVYVLTALRRRSRRGNEAAMKYFIMGAFATGFLLYGMALIYGASGTTDLRTLASNLSTTNNSALVVAGVFMMVIAFGFKLGAVPFHMWAPDVYEGAPTPVTALMAAGVKAAAIAAMLRVFVGGLGGDILPFGSFGWVSPMVVIAAITITIGNLAAIRQENIKRMLAYSSISHGGVLLVGLSAAGLGSETATSSVIYYLIAYTVTTIVAFAVLVYVGSRNRERVNVGDWAGLASQHPGAALAMTIALLSFGGIPPTGGFLGKFAIFRSAMDVYDGQLRWLVIIGVVNSAISIFYYLKIVSSMYFREPTEKFVPTRSAGLTFLIVAGTLFILQMGLMPNMWMGFGS